MRTFHCNNTTQFEQCPNGFNSAKVSKTNRPSFCEFRGAELTDTKFNPDNNPNFGFSYSLKTDSPYPYSSELHDESFARRKQRRNRTTFTLQQVNTYKLKYKLKCRENQHEKAQSVAAHFSCLAIIFHRRGEIFCRNPF